MVPTSRALRLAQKFTLLSEKRGTNLKVQELGKEIELWQMKVQMDLVLNHTCVFIPFYDQKDPPRQKINKVICVLSAPTKRQNKDIFDLEV